jgi:hypothetical protein
MTDCILTPVSATHGTCPACDPDGKRPILLHAHRNCRVQFPERLEEEQKMEVGPGTELKILLKRFGIVAGSCNCEQRATLMNQEGPDWCEQNLDTIVDWLVEEAKARGFGAVELASRVMARLIVKSAIRRSRKKLEILSR